MTSLALPEAARGEKRNLLRATGRAFDDAIRPAALHHVLQAVVAVGKVDDGLLESFRYFDRVHGEPQFSENTASARCLSSAELFTAQGGFSRLRRTDVEHWVVLLTQC